MIILPALLDKTRNRPNRIEFEETYRIPDSEYHADFWESVYAFMYAIKLRSPVRRDIEKYINPLFGYFGFRVHPVTQKTRYFHTGVSLDIQFGRKIYPVAKGVLEYSGYGAINGHYVLLSHPEIQTEDGYVLHSMYCHLKKPLIKFNSYQKMLREISLGSHPIIEIEPDQVLGLASTSGLSRDNFPGIYLQLSFRKFNTTPIVIDPMRVYHSYTKINTSAEITDPEIVTTLFKDKKK